MQQATATLRTATSADTAALIAFYKREGSPYLIPRARGELEAAVRLGRLFIVEQQGAIVAASGVFTYDDASPVVELSDTNVSAAALGVGLQSLFLRLRVAAVVIAEGCSTTITTAVDPTNDKSIANVTAGGFLPWAPIASVYSGCSTCPRRNPPRPCCCDYYYLPLESQRTAVAQLLASFTNPTITLQRKDRQLDLHVQCRILIDPEYRSMAEEFAKGATW